MRRVFRTLKLLELPFEAGVLAAVTEFQLLRRRPVRELLLDSERAAGSKTLSPPHSRIVCARVASAVRITYRVFCARNCLRESLVLYRMLRRRGIDAEFRIGVSKTGNDFFGHAWVEHEGRPVLDGATAATFVPLPPIIRRGEG